jgi:hypothetical protein
MPRRNTAFYTALASSGIGAQILGRVMPEMSLGAHAVIADGALAAHDRRITGRRHRPAGPDANVPYSDDRHADVEALLSTELPPESRYRSF